MMCHKILTIKEAAEHVGRIQQEGRRVVLTFGSFDLLHPGHTRYLAAARSLGDALLVAVESDDLVRARRGAGRPLSPAAERAEILAALATVNYVIIHDAPSRAALVARLCPRVVALPAHPDVRDDVQPEKVQAAGGQIVRLPETPGYSTSALIRVAAQNLG